MLCVLIGRTPRAVGALRVLMLGAWLCHVLVGCTNAAILALQVGRGATGVDLELMVFAFETAISKTFMIP